MSDSDLDLSNIKIKEIDLRLVPKRKRTDPPPHPFFQWNGVMHKFQVTDPQNRYPYVDLDVLLRELTRKNQAHCGDGWIETMPARAEVWCRKEVSEQVQNLLKIGGLDASMVFTKTNTWKYEPHNIVEYVLDDGEGGDDITRKALMPLILDECDATQLNVTMHLVEPDLTTPCRTLRIGFGCPNGQLRGDAYCNFPKWAQLVPTPNKDLAEFTSEHPVIHMPGALYTFTFPNSIAKFSILCYDARIRRKLFQNSWEKFGFGSGSD